MGEQLVIRGLPQGLARDAWWFTDEADEAPEAGFPKVGPSSEASRIPPKALGVLAVLVVLADQVFWDRDLGISVAIYALVLSAGMLTLKPGGATLREAMIVLGFVSLCCLPVIEMVQPLSLAFCAVGVGGVVIWITLGPAPKPLEAFDMLADLAFLGPFRLPTAAVSELRHSSTDLDLSTLARSTVLPLGIGVVFVGLFAVANPLVENALTRLTSVGSLSPEHAVRPVFWIIGACLVWPILQAHAHWTGKPETKLPLSLPSFGLINAASVRTSLILFNVLFAVQTLSDLGILTGGVSLPEGMSYAEYAHRGAYPLLVTALLSGGFAMATHRMIRDNTLLRGLMYLWLGQTMFLVLTAALRLGTYVEAYSLTHLRVAAFIWMALILVGLALIIVQMVQERSFSWLLGSNVIAAAGVLYLCCFVNFTHLITDYNMAHTPPEALDLAHLCSLGEQVIPAMMEYGQITDQTACGRGSLPQIRFEPIEHWQEWGFRRWRLQRYLETYHDL